MRALLLTEKIMCFIWFEIALKKQTNASSEIPITYCDYLMNIQVEYMLRHYRINIYFG